MINGVTLSCDYKGRVLRMESIADANGWRFKVTDESGNIVCNVPMNGDDIHGWEWQSPGENDIDKSNYVMGEIWRMIESELDRVMPENS